MDITPPRLVSFSMPSTLDLSAGARNLSLRVDARDETGGSGPGWAQVWMQQSLISPLGPSQAIMIGAPGSADPLSDGSASYVFPVGAATPPGVYRIYEVAVYDMAGNVKHYFDSDLAAMGFNTAVTITGGVADATAPELTGLVLPGLVDISGGAQQLSFTAHAQDGAGSGVAGVDLFFDRDFYLDTFTGPAVSIGGFVGGSDTFYDGTLNSAAYTGTLLAETGLGVYNLLSAVVTDQSGNAREYTAAQLAAMGINTRFEVRDGVPAEVPGDAPVSGPVPGPTVIQGGAGLDEVAYAEASTGFTLRKSGGGYLVTDGRGISNALVNVERVAFSDQTIALDADGNAGQAYRLYQAAFDRQPDLPGLGYWISHLDAGLALRDVAASFLGSQEFTRLYGTAQPNQQFVTELYHNVLHRNPEQAGLDFWVRALDNGAMRTQLLVDFSESAENMAQVIGSIEHGIAYIPY
ncbi:DUF4214 domain-containing protein [Pseudoduganella aquatica]|uniref:DUF4214 domain-containing protein n=1 Tax=Pseudoduganella aquatica TaxID=2660641 RepID=UPI001E403622|nr:DUF4214 domain-containing protein [Pseudoduganella aquatica]